MRAAPFQACTSWRVALRRPSGHNLVDVGRLALGGAAQAKVAGEYRELEARLKQSQHLMWFAKLQDAARMRERHGGEIANLSAGFEALEAEVAQITGR